MVRISIFSTLASGISIIIQFSYRTFFLMILSKEYLGIEGLFSNVIQLLSLAELGIGTIISYRLYKPLEERNIEQVSVIMFFFQKVYLIIAIVVTVLGVLLIPILKYLIKDINEIPSDVSLYVVYILFLSQSIASYFFTYKQTILVADQRGDIVAIYNTITSLIKTILQIVILNITHNYQIVLFGSIFISIVLNWLFSSYIEQLYREIFANKVQISSELKNEIFHDLKATLCHKIGGIVSTSTDNLVLSAFVGLGKLGIYSNYTLILDAVKKVIMQALGNFTASVGNAGIQMKGEEYYRFYEKMLVLNFFFTDVTSICILVLINPFIELWQGVDMVFSFTEVIVIVGCYYINTIRLINISFTNAAGLYIKDMLRPLIEDAINLIISIFLTINCGMIGVFIGTIISHILTVGWREPLILYRYSFKKSVSRYWFLYIKNFCVTITVFILIRFIFSCNVRNYFQWIFHAIISFVLTFIFVTLFFYKELKVWKR